MNYRLKKKSTFFIILLTYILTLTVPLIVLFQFMFPKLEKELSSQLEESLQSEVAVNASHFNDIIVTLNNCELPKINPLNAGFHPNNYAKFTCPACLQAYSVLFCSSSDVSPEVINARISS